MKRHFLFLVFIAFAMLCGAQTPWDGTVADNYDGGDGTPENPYRIATAEQLALLAAQTNNGTGGNVNYILTNDLILNEGDSLLWTPIGNVGPFTGTFDGNNHVISGLYVNGEKISGLFAQTENALIKNVRLEKANVLEYEQAYVYSAFGGMLIGKARNTHVLDCSVDGLIEIFSAVANGGLIGRCEVDLDDLDTVFIKNCVNYAAVHDNERCGGIVAKTIIGNGNLVMDKCVNYGYVNGWTFAGGIVGEGSFIIRNCDNYGEVASEACAGGMVGQGGSFGLITNCFNHESGKITGQNAGGIIGTAIFTVMNCCGNEALITGMDDDEIMVGGISSADGTIYNCYNRGDLTAVFTSNNPVLIQMGGIAGTPPGDECIRNVYNTGTIIKPSNASIPNRWYGYIVPAILTDTVIENCYWIRDESITEYVWNMEANGWVHLPNSSHILQGPTATSWILTNPQYGTNDLLEALNAGAMGKCIWIEDVEGVNGGFPIPTLDGSVGVEEAHDDPVALATTFPNPGHEHLSIKTELQDAEIMVFDVFGRMLCHQSISESIININTSSWPSGMYLWRLVSGDRVMETGKWVKE